MPNLTFWPVHACGVQHATPWHILRIESAQVRRRNLGDCLGSSHDMPTHSLGFRQIWLVDQFTGTSPQKVPRHCSMMSFDARAYNLCNGIFVTVFVRLDRRDLSFFVLSVNCEAVQKCQWRHVNVVRLPSCVFLFVFLSINLSWDLSKREKRTCSGHTWFRDVERFVFVFNVKCWHAEGWCVCLCGDVLDENDVVWTLATDKTTGRYVLSSMCALFSTDVSSQVVFCCCCCLAKLYLIFSLVSFFCLSLRCVVVTP